ncbi:MAG: NAD+ synthase [Candidatus Marinimicrobia bacterium]|nr:NAD+ synthase [Candidatus Neomarinimicrobiota bacterium]
MKNIKTAIAQKNFTVGDLKSNFEIIVNSIENAKNNGAEIIVFPELSLSGYFPKDLLLNNKFISDNEKYMKMIADKTNSIVALVGFVSRNGNDIYNSVAVIQNRKIVKIINKNNLTYTEKRYFSEGKSSEIISVKIDNYTYNVGVDFTNNFEIDDKNSEKYGEGKANFLFLFGNSAYSFNKLEKRRDAIVEKAKKIKTPIIYTNIVGGQDDLIYDGNSFAVDKNGNPIAICDGNKENMKFFKIAESDVLSSFEPIDKMEELFKSLVLGIRDYFVKTGFKEAILGLSGGIDSALVAVLVSEAIGSENVYSYSMPSNFSTDHSITDAENLAKNLGINYKEIPIKDSYDNLLSTLDSEFSGTKFGIAEENLQARIRGIILMSIANKFNRLVLATGNKTEVFLGYFTLYGDSNGALAPISDLNKILVYSLSNHINKRTSREIIPQNIIDKKPSAELKDEQYDPFDYEKIAPLVDEIIDNNLTKNELLKMNYDEKMIDEVMNLIQKSEYKRHQLVTGLKVSDAMVHKNRKMPIINRF